MPQGLSFRGNTLCLLLMAALSLCASQPSFWKEHSSLMGSVLPYLLLSAPVLGRLASGYGNCSLRAPSCNMERAGVSFGACSPWALPPNALSDVPDAAFLAFIPRLCPLLLGLLGGGFMFPAAQSSMPGLLRVLTLSSSPHRNWEISESVTSRHTRTCTSRQVQLLGSRSPRLRPAPKVFKSPLSRLSAASLSLRQSVLRPFPSSPCVPSGKGGTDHPGPPGPLLPPCCQRPGPLGFSSFPALPLPPLP